MSDDVRTVSTVNAPPRAVMRDHNNLYYVFEYVQGEGYVRALDRGYTHSTSAYAQLGRMTNRENQRALLLIKGDK